MAAFTPSGSGGQATSVVVQGATNPTISNVSLAVAATEVSIVLPNDLKQFLIKLRDPLAKLQISYISGQSGVLYITIPPGCFYSDSNLTASGVTLYVQSPSASQVVELVTWT